MAGERVEVVGCGSERGVQRGLLERQTGSSGGLRIGSRITFPRVFETVFVKLPPGDQKATIPMAVWGTSRDLRK